MLLPFVTFDHSYAPSGELNGKSYPGGGLIAWYDGEGCGSGNTQRAIAEGFDMSAFFNVTTSESLDTEDGVEELRQQLLQISKMREGAPVSILVLDGVTNLTGRSDENSAKEGARHMVLLTKMIQSLPWDLQPCAILLTHSKKTNWESNQGPAITAPNISELRGSGNMIGNCRCALAVTHAGCDPAYSDRRIVFNNRNSFNPEGLMDPIAFQRLPDGRVVECQMPPLQQRPPAAAPMDKEAELVLNAVDHYLLHFFKTYGG